MEKFMSGVHEQPVKWGLALISAWLGVELDIVALNAFTWVMIGHSIIGAMKAVRIGASFRAIDISRFLSGIIKYASVMLLMMMVALISKEVGMDGYNILARRVVWLLIGILIYYSCVNVGSIWTGKEYRKEDLIELLFRSLSNWAKNLPKNIINQLNNESKDTKGKDKQ